MLNGNRWHGLTTFSFYLRPVRRVLPIVRNPKQRRTTQPKLIAPNVAGIEVRPPVQQRAPGGSCLAILPPGLRSANPGAHCRTPGRRKRQQPSTEGASSSSSAKSSRPGSRQLRATHRQRRSTRAHRERLELRVIITGSRCRRIVARVKRNLFDDRPLPFDPRPERRRQATIGFDSKIKALGSLLPK